VKPPHRAPLALIALAVLSLVAGCTSMNRVEHRTTQGPTAREMWLVRMLLQNGREPTFDERQSWQDQLDLKIARWLTDHPEDANALGVANFRFDRRVAVGMSKEQILMLIDSPIAITSDEGEMEKLARRFWPLLKGNVTEAWVYPQGWNLYFAGPRLVDITQYGPGS
jgi:hypothetical protein